MENHALYVKSDYQQLLSVPSHCHNETVIQNLSHSVFGLHGKVLIVVGLQGWLL